MTAPCSLAYHELVFIHVSDDIVCLGCLRNLATGRVVTPVYHLPHSTGRVLAARRVEKVAETGVGIIGICNHDRPVGRSFAACDKIGTGKGCDIAADS
jgi:hypothetical protein